MQVKKDDTRWFGAEEESAGLLSWRIDSYMLEFAAKMLGASRRKRLKGEGLEGGERRKGRNNIVDPKL